MQSELDVEEASPPFILVVEDDPLIRYAIACNLRDEGATVAEAATADEAWQFLQVSRNIDVVFTDFRMPGSMNGAELAEKIVENFPGLQVILTSGEYKGHGFAGRFVPKPYSLIEITAELLRVAKERKQGSAS